MNLSKWQSVCLLNVALSASMFSGAMATQDQQIDEAAFDRVRTVNILQEPRHRTVHTDGHLRLIDVQINPADTTLPHTHDSAILYTFISNGAGPLNGRVSSTTSYVDEHFTHRVTNEGPGLFRIIALANYGPAVAGTVLPVQGLNVQAQLENAWFRSFRLELGAGESSTPITHAYPVAIVQVSDGRIHVTRADGITNELQATGDWAWRAAGQAYQIHNKSDKPVSFVINEGLR